MNSTFNYLITVIKQRMVKTLKVIFKGTFGGVFNCVLCDVIALL